jgi:hypothetical protein
MKELLIESMNLFRRRRKLGQETEEEYQMEQKIADFLKEKCSFCGGEHNLDSCPSYLTTITMG